MIVNVMSLILCEEGNCAGHMERHQGSCRNYAPGPSLPDCLYCGKPKRSHKGERLNEKMRLKIAREYLVHLGKLKEPKLALLQIHNLYGAKRSSVYDYVAELREKERPKLGRVRAGKN